MVTKVNVAYSLSQSVCLSTRKRTESYRPGGANQVVGLPVERTPYEADSLWSYEIGAEEPAGLPADDAQRTRRSASTGTTCRSPAPTPDGAFRFISNAGAAQIDGVGGRGRFTQMQEA